VDADSPGNSRSSLRELFLVVVIVFLWFSKGAIAVMERIAPEF
jgi:hypothetical protein